MDHRCPVCGTNQTKSKFGQSIVMRMETECAHCHGRLRLNVHPAESFVVVLDFAAIIVLAAFAYWFQSRELVLFAVGAAMLGASVLPAIERTYLRSWPRYVSAVQASEP